MVFPDFEEYFETVRRLVGEPEGGIVGRPLPKFDSKWFEVFMEGHERRKKWWREQNERARLELATPRARL